MEKTRQPSARMSAEAGSVEEELVAASQGTGRSPTRTSRPLLTTAVLFGVATAVLQPELLVGIAIGAGVVMASRWLGGVPAGDPIVDPPPPHHSNVPPHKKA
jgi:hypothetical protein